MRLVFETRAKCQDFVARFFEDDGITYSINSPFCCTITNIISANPNQLKTERLENNLAPLWRELADQLKVLFPDGDDEGAFIIQRSMLAHMSSASKIEETELENRCSNLLLLEVDKHLPLLHLSCLFLVFLLKLLQRVLSQANKVNV